MSFETKKLILDVLESKGVDNLVGLISTGSGQELPEDLFTVTCEIPYIDLPGMGDANVPGHQGILRVVDGPIGDWAVWTGRRHFYQGYTHDEIGLYIDVSAALGADELICLNAAGGLNPDLVVGQMVSIERYRCFTPLPGLHREIDGGPWRETDSGIREKLLRVAEEQALSLTSGAYAGVPGPTYETASEVDWLRSLGCDVVGMSTVAELIRAAELGIKASAVSVVANVHGSGTKLTHDEVVKSSEAAVIKLARIISKYIAQI